MSNIAAWSWREDVNDREKKYVYLFSTISAKLLGYTWSEIHVYQGLAVFVTISMSSPKCYIYSIHEYADLDKPVVSTRR